MFSNFENEVENPRVEKKTEKQFTTKNILGKKIDSLFFSIQSSLNI